MINQPVRNFVLRSKPDLRRDATAVSLFSGAGLSDLGFALAGFNFVIQVESDPKRSAIGADNFPESTWITGDVRTHHDEIASRYQAATQRRLDLLVATPPCQGMSSSNPSRGKRQTPKARALDEKNRLILEVIPVARSLNPRIIVAENVRQILTLHVDHDCVSTSIVDILREELPEYEVFSRVVNVADHGIAQIRRRALIIAVHNQERWLRSIIRRNRTLWPSQMHSDRPTDGMLPWVTVQEWLTAMKYETLDAESPETGRGNHPLHFVPTYGPDRYLQVSDIPSYSGRSAYENDNCRSCGYFPVPLGEILCPKCGNTMRNRPYVDKEGDIRLVKGFKSSYRRMHPNRPSYTITTNSSHVGSDFKIHPWENRVLSILECADLQTVPRFYDWTRAQENQNYYLIRALVGEAFPTYFTYLQGCVLVKLLSENVVTPQMYAREFSQIAA